MSYLHPTRASHARSHEPAFKAVVGRLTDAVHRAHSVEKKYNSVFVGSLRWSNDDLNLGGIERDLLKTFRDVYNFPTDSFSIPHSHPNIMAQVMNWLLPMINKAQAQDLLIILYEGHSEASGPNQDQLSL